MKTIWKWGIFPATEIEMPIGAQVLCVQSQNEEPQLWAMVDPTKETEKRTFVIHGTGHGLPEDPGCYIGTFQLNDGSFVFHVFETTGSTIVGGRL